MKSKAWTVAMVMIALGVTRDLVIHAWTQEPISVFTAWAAAGYIFTYCIARLAEAWRIKLWESDR